jgi:hypothetical protein
MLSFTHLRRPAADPLIAADVLEVRCLLSSAAGAAHAALHHATLEDHTVATGSVKPPGFHSSNINAEVTIQGGTPVAVPVKFSLAPFKLVNGAKVTAHASASEIVSGNKVTLRATFVGTIQLIEAAGAKVIITPTGGSIVDSIKGPSTHFTATAVPDGTDTLIFLNGGNFQSFGATDKFTANAPVGFANKTVQVVVDAP